MSSSSSTSKRKKSAEITESASIKSLRRVIEKERIMRLKANQKLALLEKLFSAKLRAMNVKIDDLTDGKFDEIQKRVCMSNTAYIFVHSSTIDANE